MIRVAINGACGRMGMRLVDLVCEDSDMALVAALETGDHPSLGRDVGAAAGKGEISVKVASAIEEELDVLIDFSAPASTAARAPECADAGIAMVIGTTGLEQAQMDAVKDAAARTPIFMAPNMSVGVNVLLDAAARVAAALGPAYDCEIIEVHHRFKKDAPSGTALKFAGAIAQATGRDLEKCGTYGRKGQTGERRAGEIGVHAVRAGDVVGEHRILFATLGETVELVHRAHTRDTFARGALRAARFIVGRPAGMYGMEHLLRGGE